MTDRELLEMALEALELDAYGEPPRHERNVAIAALQERLAQPEEKYRYGTPLLDAIEKGETK